MLNYDDINIFIIVKITIPAIPYRHYYFSVSTFPLSFQKAYFKGNIHHIMSSPNLVATGKLLTLGGRLSMNGSSLITVCVSLERFLGNVIKSELNF